jgi:uncharacterized protein YcfJ
LFCVKNALELESRARSDDQPIPTARIVFLGENHLTNLKKLSLAGATAAVLAMGMVPDTASAYYRHHHRHYRYYRACHHRRNAVIGTVGGGVGGGLIGSALSHGSPVGIVAGAAGGALIGHQVGKHSC